MATAEPEKSMEWSILIPETNFENKGEQLPGIVCTIIQKVKIDFVAIMFIVFSYEFEIPITSVEK